MEDGGTVGAVLRLLNEQGPYIGAGTALFFFLLQTYFDLGRTEKRSFGDNVKTGVVLLGAFSSMGYAFWSLQNEYEPMTEARRAHDAIVSYYDRCRERVAAFSPETKAEIVERRMTHARPGDEERTTNWLLQSDCLALAVRNSPIGSDQTSQIGWLNKDIALGDLLLRGDKEDETTIATTLYRIYGVNSDDYLGTGRSLPVSNAPNISRYSHAAMREYWAPNVCAVSSISAEVCPARFPYVWGWRFDSLNDVDDLTVRELLTHPTRRILPMEGGDTLEFATLLQRLEKGGNLEAPTDLLIRFHTFPNERYLGTVGRPEARYVFMSSMQDAIDLPIRTALRLSGADDPDEGRHDAPDLRTFIWVYQPATETEYRLATWRDLFTHLRDLQVDARVLEAAEARVRPAVQSAQPATTP